ncbi:amidohydrolase [Allorhizobium taibaishanense]|uniref:Amidohydrolase n=1 Tax=Allorhizobium taibaishanense TaxID=887144 RepID=A0A1Q9A9E0_9HYPH|nr:amidohydrolase [Allorhizobium taibaishanense]MBB4009856.1 aminobenzoyl-glutamate utilization protein B [Allorhizobium taibaishanense]OLP51491.1 amidohydrolase [Allorhizobium taibaishanense]
MTVSSNTSSALWAIIDAKTSDFIALSDRICGMPETCYMEEASVAEHAAMLEAEGFRVTRGLANIPTAVMGEAGEGGPVIAFLGEYDALSGLSQEAGIAEHRPITPGGNGHGCGHNLLGSAALLAATALKDWLKQQGMPGRVRYYGCPAEEGGAAKAFMVRAGAFDGVDIAISWHPSSFAGVQRTTSLANSRVDFTFRGRAAHAGSNPDLGRSALDAVELMSVGVNYMREHMPSDCRVHAAILDAGGISPNVVQAYAKVRYLIRAPELQGMKTLVERVKKIGEGAALMTETRLETQVISAVSNVLTNGPLMAAMQSAWDELGPPPFDDADRAFAERIRATLTPEEKSAPWRFECLAERDTPVADFIIPAHDRTPLLTGSTDVGDVSWVVPTVQADGPTCAIGTPFHTWQLVAQGKSALAHKGMITTAKVMAATGRAAFESESLREAALADLVARRKGQPYQSPLPEGAEPPITEMGGRK